MMEENWLRTENEVNHGDLVCQHPRVSPIVNLFACFLNYFKQIGSALMTTNADFYDFMHCLNCVVKVSNNCIVFTGLFTAEFCEIS